MGFIALIFRRMPVSSFLLCCMHDFHSPRPIFYRENVLYFEVCHEIVELRAPSQAPIQLLFGG